MIFRRQFVQLTELVEQSIRAVRALHEAFTPHKPFPKFNANQFAWYNLPGDRRLEFAAVDREEDVEKYMGRPHDLKGYDELPNFSERQFRFLNGWTRTTTPGQRCRVVGAGNPPMNAEGEWVLRFWGPWLDPQHPSPAVPGELRYFANVGGEDKECENDTPFWFRPKNGKAEEIRPRSRTFIPALVTDNPLLMSTDYVATLQGLPEPLRSQLLYGSMEAGRDDDPWQVIPTAWVDAAMERGRHNTHAPDMPMTALGADIARGGSAQTVLAPRYGAWFAPLIKLAGAKTPDGPSAATQITKHAKDKSYICFDVIGVGAAVFDSLKHSHPDGEFRRRLRPFNSSEAARYKSGKPLTDKSKQLTFINKRAAAYWRLREALDPTSGEDLILPYDTQLRADLCAPRWRVMVSGIKIEAKDEIEKRLKRSTDCGDAVVYAAWDDRLLGGGNPTTMGGRPELSDFVVR